MKRVTTNMTFGQIIFVLFILVVSSLMFFYLGAKFGGDIMSLTDQHKQEVNEPFLPDDKLTSEIENILSTHTEKLVFHDVVEGKKAMQDVTPTEANKAQETHAPTPMVVPVKIDDAKKTVTTTDVKTAKPGSPKPIVADGKPASLDKSQTPLKVLLPGTKTTNTNVMTSPQIKTAASDKNDTAKTVLMPAVHESYHLQLGSYADRARALEAKSEWEKRGFAVSLIETNIPGKGVWFHLGVGRYDSLTAAQSAQRQVMRDYQQSAMVQSGH